MYCNSSSAQDLANIMLEEDVLILHTCTCICSLYKRKQHHGVQSIRHKSISFRTIFRGGKKLSSKKAGGGGQIVNFFNGTQGGQI